MKDGWIKVAAASPVLRVADCDYNAQQIVAAMRRADALGVKLLVFPALTLCGVSCYALREHRMLLEGAQRALRQVVEASYGTDMLCFVGLPLRVGSAVYSAAAAVCNGELLGYTAGELPEECDGSWIESELSPDGGCGLHRDMLFTHARCPDIKIAVEPEAGLDRATAHTGALAKKGAVLIAQMGSFAKTVDSTEAALLNVRYESKTWKTGLLLAAPGAGESTTDRVYSGLCLAAENGKILAQSEGEDALCVTEIDVQYMQELRRGISDFERGAPALVWDAACAETALTRPVSRCPDLPEDEEALRRYCRDMLDIQVAGLVRRMRYARLDHCVVGISGGVDSTLSVLVCAEAMKKMGLPASNLVAVTMPCFGTSSRTRANAVALAGSLGAQLRVIDITDSVLRHFDDIGHAHDDYSVAFENAQARERTQVLMDIANKVNGLDVGTEDMSEYIDGWCTFCGDHASMYDVNLGLTKTQVRSLVAQIAEESGNAALRAVLRDVLDCPISPELLPVRDDEISQKSEDTVGSYSLQDFFTHCILRCGFTPRKTFRLAKIAYGDEYGDAALLGWLKSYGKRLFSQQFKRGCLMDGPAVTDFTLSPRCGLRLPSDAEDAIFQQELEELTQELKP